MITVPKLVTKPWGNELWIADGTNTPYANKKIFFKKGKQTSLQVHKKKYETSYVLSGQGVLLLSDKWFDVDSYLNGSMPDDDVENHISSLLRYPIREGVTFDIAPGHLHRVIAVTDLTFIETSTCELDDVVRLLDDTGRLHGRIDAEHR